MPSVGNEGRITNVSLSERRAQTCLSFAERQKRWSSERRGWVYSDYPESWQRKTKSNEDSFAKRRPWPSIAQENKIAISTSKTNFPHPQKQWKQEYDVKTTVKLILNNAPQLCKLYLKKKKDFLDFFPKKAFSRDENLFHMLLFFSKMSNFAKNTAYIYVASLWLSDVPMVWSREKLDIIKVNISL